MRTAAAELGFIASISTKKGRNRILKQKINT